MSQANVKPPNLPLAPPAYDRGYQDQVNNALRLFFNRITSSGPMTASALNFDLKYLPTDESFDELRSGDVYYDTSGGDATSYPLRIKA